jgi:hypothetical protein
MLFNNREISELLICFVYAENTQKYCPVSKRILKVAEIVSRLIIPPIGHA